MVEMKPAGGWGVFYRGNLCLVQCGEVDDSFVKAVFPSEEEARRFHNGMPRDDYDNSTVSPVEIRAGNPDP